MTGTSGFIGGQVARSLAAAGYRVRGLCRRHPRIEPGDPEIDWQFGDLRDPAVRAKAIAGMRGVIHCAGWVSLGFDRRGESWAVNVEATRALLNEAQDAGVERFIYTSTLWTVATGTPDSPATEESPWNLNRLHSAYCDSKREAERLVLDAADADFATSALCPGMVIGPRDPGPSSTKLIHIIAGTPVAVLPHGGLPVVDVRVVAQAHIRAIESAEPGERYAVAGPYVDYHGLADEIRRVSGWPHGVINVPDWLERPFSLAASCLGRVPVGPLPNFSPAVVAGGFLRLHVSGERADREFGLDHPPLARSIYDTLAYAQRRGHVRGLRLKPPISTISPEPAAPLTSRGPAW